MKICINFNIIFDFALNRNHCVSIDYKYGENSENSKNFQKIEVKHITNEVALKF